MVVHNDGDDHLFKIAYPDQAVGPSSEVLARAGKVLIEAICRNSSPADALLEDANDLVDLLRLGRLVESCIASPGMCRTAQQAFPGRERVHEALKNRSRTGTAMSSSLGEGRAAEVRQWRAQVPPTAVPLAAAKPVPREQLSVLGDEAQSSRQATVGCRLRSRCPIATDRPSPELPLLVAEKVGGKVTRLSLPS